MYLYKRSKTYLSSFTLKQLSIETKHQNLHFVLRTRNLMLLSIVGGVRKGQARPGRGNLPFSGWPTYHIPVWMCLCLCYCLFIARDTKSSCQSRTLKLHIETLILVQILDLFFHKILTLSFSLAAQVKSRC